MVSKLEKLTVWVSIAIIYLLMIGFFFSPKKDFSENENRNLAKAPEITADSIFSGKLMDDTKEYLTDHFPMRDFWVSLNTETDIAMGSGMINDIYVGQGGFLMEKYKESDSVQRIIDTFSKFKNKIQDISSNINMKLMLVPTAVTVYADYLPMFSQNASQLETINKIYKESGIDSIDVATALLNAAADEGNDSANEADSSVNEKLYYRTDHHWTTYGAYVGYKKLCEAFNLDVKPLEYFTKEVATRDFHGSYSAKVNRFNEKGDSIILYESQNQKLSVIYPDTKVVTDTLFNREYLNKRDKYSMFLNNIHPFIEISNENSSSQRSMVIIKDSYANSLVPFLTDDFSKIYVFDTRHYKNGISNFIKEHEDVTDVLILYNMGTIDTDAGIRGIY